MHLFEKIETEIVDATHRVYGKSVDPGLLSVGPTRKDFAGDMTVVVFPLVKLLRKSPLEIGNFIGEHLVAKMDEIASFNVVQGFVNLTLTKSFWHIFLTSAHADPDFGSLQRNGEKVMIEFASPNTNKPLHLGHIRNILLGWSCAQILEMAGFEVVKVQVINDRGIAICKSMLAWQLYGERITPASSGIKGDHLVGQFYVEFEKRLSAEYAEWQTSTEASKIITEQKEEEQSVSSFFKAFKNQYFNTYSDLGAKARTMLQKWEEGDPEIRQLWEMMNNWVYAGFDRTYDRLGVTFDRLYYESETWQLGKKEIMDGLKRNLFDKQEDGSIWVDLDHVNLDKKILLRSDGTAVYITQDIGTAMQRYRDYGIDRMVYVVADEQNHHFKVLFEILNLLEEPYADGLYHLAYGMVDLPDGKMKSREGTVVDADDLIASVTEVAESLAIEKGDLDNLNKGEREEVFKRIGMGALKFFILKINPLKRMTFDPQASVDMQGQTGPYVQNAYVRIQSILRKAGSFTVDPMHTYIDFQPTEKHLLSLLFMFPEVIRRAASEYDPSLVANYCYDLAKSYHRFYHDAPILNARKEEARSFRLTLNAAIAQVLSRGMKLLGIDMPARM
ncbi:MAG: arginine--tRNA ligase [Saprospiraceae bacterium]|nr:arginine--tRNA ligase [Saprospiraceae bacterium]